MSCGDQISERMQICDLSKAGWDKPSPAGYHSTPLIFVTVSDHDIVWRWEASELAETLSDSDLRKNLRVVREQAPLPGIILSNGSTKDCSKTKEVQGIIDQELTCSSRHPCGLGSEKEWYGEMH